MRIRQGLEEVVGGRVLVDGKALGELSGKVDADELITLWCGKEIDDEGLAAWRAHTRASDAARQQAEWFWQWLADREPSYRSKVLEFTTASARLPRDLDGWQFEIGRQHNPVRVQPTDENELNSPVLLAKASTCPKLLLLPAWESADDLAKGMDFSIEYGGGFGSC